MDSVDLDEQARCGGSRCLFYDGEMLKLQAFRVAKPKWVYIIAVDHFNSNAAARVNLRNADGSAFVPKQVWYPRVAHPVVVEGFEWMDLHYVMSLKKNRWCIAEGLTGQRVGNIYYKDIHGQAEAVMMARGELTSNSGVLLTTLSHALKRYELSPRYEVLRDPRRIRITEDADETFSLHKCNYDINKELAPPERVIR